MEEESKAIKEQQADDMDIFILLTNIGVVIILCLCAFVYFVIENKLELADKVCKNISSFSEQIKILSIFVVSCSFLISIALRNNKKSKIYQTNELAKYIISMLFLPFFFIHAIVCT